jgi:hypothetical protein
LLVVIEELGPVGDGIREAMANPAGSRATTRNSAMEGGTRRMAPTVLSNFTAQAKAILGHSRIFDLRCLSVEPDAECDGSGGVVLRGSVDSFYHKQLAQELLKTAIPGIEVVNLIQVEYSPERALGQSEWN